MSDSGCHANKNQISKFHYSYRKYLQVSGGSIKFAVAGTIRNFPPLNYRKSRNIRNNLRRDDILNRKLDCFHPIQNVICNVCKDVYRYKMYYTKNAICIIFLMQLLELYGYVQVSVTYYLSSSIDKLLSKAIHLVVRCTIFQRIIG